MKKMISTMKAMSLAGEWFYKLDPNFLGEMQRWFKHDLSTNNIIELPNTLDTAGIGTINTTYEAGRPARKVKFEGCAWFQRKVFIPDEWSDKKIVLFMERCSRCSRIWVDGIFIGTEDSISTPHKYDLSKYMTPGVHLLTIEVENTYARSYGAGVFIGRWCTAICDDLQTNWNGIIGRFELIAEDQAYLSNVRILPSLKEEKANFKIEISNLSEKLLTGKIKITIIDRLNGIVFKIVEIPFDGMGKNILVEADVSMQGARVWNDTNPELYDATVELVASLGEISFESSKSYTFGYRDFCKGKTQFFLNGEVVFLRGSVEYTGFAKTGHPPADNRSVWEKIFRISKAYGINHYRFHSYCPPEIAFVVADELGMLLHVEVPVWAEKPGSGEQEELLDFIEREAKRIIDVYYNHPSFVMLGLGNEYQSNFDYLDQIISNLKDFCPDKLYTFSTNYISDVPTPKSDYFITNHTLSGKLRLNSWDEKVGIDGNDTDYNECVKDVNMPLVAHELGQWITYPDFKYLEKYNDTIFDPRVMKDLSGLLSSMGMKEQNNDMHHASGTFSWLIYKEEIEAMLRTSGIGGFQLLSLADSPGWGEAFTGVLDPFWDPKPFMSGDKMKTFCSDVVPLMRTKHHVYKNTQSFCGEIQIANYSRTSFENAVLEWEIYDSNGTLANGEIHVALLEKGKVSHIGSIVQELNAVTSARQFQVKLLLRDTKYQNSWSIWVYPDTTSETPTGDVHICYKLDDECNRLLDEGKTVLYLASPSDCETRVTRFLPTFWSLWWFWRSQAPQPGVLGVLCDPLHPAFEGFPTDRHSNFQWSDIMENGHAFVVDKDEKNLSLVVQLIDDYHINNKLASIIEASVSNGRLIACSFDLETKRETSLSIKQLYRSLLQYMNSEQFEPKSSCTLDEVKHSLGYKY